MWAATIKRSMVAPILVHCLLIVEGIVLDVSRGVITRNASGLCFRIILLHTPQSKQYSFLTKREIFMNYFPYM